VKIDLIAVGTRSPDWVVSGYNEYEKRLPRECELNLIEIPVARRSSNTSVDQLKQQEGEKMLSLIKPQSMVIALDQRGKNWSTEQLAGKMQRWMNESPQVSLLVGGPDGLADVCLAKAQEKWSLSALTFPHFLVRILLAEQIYRAFSVLNNHPYHRA